MHKYTVTILPLFICIFALLILSNPATSQDKPNLSDALREMIDNKGVEAANQHFSSMNSSEREQYTVDMEGISELTNTYLEEGNMEALMAISEISGPFMQDMVSRSMEQYAPEMEAMEEMAKEQEAEREQDAQQRQEERTLERQQAIMERQGQPRDDLERFKGVYGNPDEPESARQLWVNVSCDGYLVSGAMWGDAAPWWLRSESENVFTMEDSFNNVRLEFTPGGDDLEMIHNLDFMENPLQRVGPLPEDWNSCMERYR
ncbi:hypothetical protein [Rhodohalobacter sulfatireducens]|uniref:DUF4412 domain-containing protein n=1 Tax=Rhodohalobacter sulfatireducens TaxID=2911366 RepID=A0ABS9K870_9BACT|nr:hypothetical protein [Rhodohalobacter sulfatireducens]MCG2587059.1 hypothetical protein [Rhodohalobacter sulfatireducens]